MFFYTLPSHNFKYFTGLLKIKIVRVNFYWNANERTKRTYEIYKTKFCFNLCLELKSFWFFILSKNIQCV